MVRASSNVSLMTRMVEKMSEVSHGEAVAPSSLYGSPASTSAVEESHAGTKFRIAVAKITSKKGGCNAKGESDIRNKANAFIPK